MALVGTCSLCSGPVTTPDVWTGCYPPPKTCQFCFAVAKESYGPVVQMNYRPKWPNYYCQPAYPYFSTFVSTNGTNTTSLDVTAGQVGLDPSKTERKF